MQLREKCVFSLSGDQILGHMTPVSKINEDLTIREDEDNRGIFLLNICQYKLA